ncbi:ankyrin repeat domain-containing protein [Saccharomonospora xinjiangensis]|uniref:ankyrin repeat domain-containing protein n=1 Tax=Saccharomonospora xinjiangensis TaxID=75294 RepID=UPI00106FD498|nr:ankyrin repeat domain-containing protein [Saccharomonospora xinjiangensis]QBQ60707.1 Ankyrin repeat protein [Saccharomonospora xinjiangensis]
MPERWQRAAASGWHDPATVRTLLAEGADPNAVLSPGASTPLHEAVFADAPAGTLESLIACGAEVDATDAGGVTPLWIAVRYGHRTAVTVLLRAGADPWTPVVSGRSPGRQALDGPLADLVRDLPGAPVIAEEERRARQRADALIGSYRWVWDWMVFLQDVTLVSGLTEDEAVRRLGADPALSRRVRSPYHDVLGDPGETTDFDDTTDITAVEEHTDVTGETGTAPPGSFPVYLGARDGGVCLLGQAAATETACRRLSEGTRLATVFVNEAKGICSVRCWEDGSELYRTDPVGLAPNDRPEEWLYRFGDGAHRSAYEARAFALLTHHTGVHIDEMWLSRGPMRGVEPHP